MKLKRLAFSFLALLLLLPAHVTAPTPGPPTKGPTREPPGQPDACQVYEWGDLFAAVAKSDGTAANPTEITLCPGIFKVEGGTIGLDGKYVHIKCGGTYCRLHRTISVFGNAFSTGSAAFHASMEGLTFENFREAAVDISNGNGSLVMKDCTFTGNSGTSVDGLRLEGTLDIQDCLFESNSGGSAVVVGGGPRATAVATISNTVFKDNSGRGFGGGLYCFGSNAQCDVTNSTFTRNQAVATGKAKGGAIYCNGATCSISGSAFTRNKARGSGGAISCETGATCSISDSTFLNNDALNGANIYCKDDSACNVDQCMCINGSYEGGLSF